MSVRVKLLQYLYDLVINEQLCEDMQKALNEADDFLMKLVPEEKKEETTDYLCELGHAAFFAGANMVLDFVSGREELIDE